MRFAHFLFLGALAWLGVSPQVYAQSSVMDRALAQQLFDEGVRMLEAGRAEEACPKLEESQRLDPAMGTQFNLADCYEKTGRTASAWINFTEVADAALKSGETERQKVARERAQAVGTRLSYLTIRVASPRDGLVIRRDGSELGRQLWGVSAPIDPGKHRVEASAPGARAWQSEVTVGPSGARVEVEVPALVAEAIQTAPVLAPIAAMTPKASTSPEPATKPDNMQRTWALVAGGAGVAGVGVGTVLLVTASGRYSDSDRYCDAQNQCNDARGVSLRDDAISLANWATLAYGLGIVGLGTGAVLWFTARDSKGPEPTASLEVVPGGGVLRGRF